MKNLDILILQCEINQNPLITRDLVLKKIASSKNSFDLIILPEMWLGGPQNKKQCQEWLKIYRVATQELGHLAKTKKCSILTTGLICQSNKFYNASFIINKDGRVKNTYRKIHLFSYGGESKIFNKPPIKTSFFTINGIKCASIICYDLRFPELTRDLAIKGCQVLFVPAQWPKSRRDHWLTLLKARAIENQIFVVGVNRLGIKKGETFSGDSALFDPWGNPLLHLGDDQESGQGRIELAKLGEIRKKYPFFSERRIKKIMWP